MLWRRKKKAQEDIEPLCTLPEEAPPPLPIADTRYEYLPYIHIMENPHPKHRFSLGKKKEEKEKKKKGTLEPASDHNVKKSRQQPITNYLALFYISALLFSSFFPASSFVVQRLSVSGLKWADLSPLALLYSSIMPCHDELLTPDLSKIFLRPGS